MGINKIYQMPLFFTDTKPRECCCGCSLTCGMWTVLVLACLETISSFITYGAAGIVPCIGTVLIALAILMKNSSTWTLVNFYFNCVYTGLFCLLMIAIPILFAVLGTVGFLSGLLISLACTCFAGPWVYLFLMISYYYHEERKEELDGDYNKV